MTEMGRDKLPPRPIVQTWTDPSGHVYRRSYDPPAVDTYIEALLREREELRQALRDADESCRKILNGDRDPFEFDPEGWHRLLAASPVAEVAPVQTEAYCNHCGRKLSIRPAAPALPAVEQTPRDIDDFSEYKRGFQDAQKMLAPPDDKDAIIGQQAETIRQMTELLRNYESSHDHLRQKCSICIKAGELLKEPA